MSRALLIARRELGAYASSPLGALVISALLLIDGVLFYVFGLSEKQPSADVLYQFFFYTSGCVAVAAVFLSMRLIAEERQLGSITLLNTSPVRDWEIVAGKFFAALAMVAIMCLLTLHMPAMILVNGKVSVGQLLVGYLGILLLGATITSVGLLGSALARSQFVALVVTGVMAAILYLAWGAARAADPPLSDFVAGLAVHHENIRPFMQGVLEPRRLVYYLAVTGFFLLAATKTLEARRWR